MSLVCMSLGGVAGISGEGTVTLPTPPLMSQLAIHLQRWSLEAGTVTG